MRTVRLLLPSLLAIAACAGDPGDDPPSTLDAAAPSASATAVAPNGALIGPLGGPFQPGELIVKTTTPIDGTSVVTIAGQRLRPLRHKPSGAWLMELEDSHRRAPGTAGTTALEHATLDALTALTADPTVEYAHENGLVEFSLTPNDTYFNQQWQWTPSRVPEAWDRTVGPLPGAPAVRIAIIDTGNRPHVELDNRWDPGFDFVDNDTDPYDPIDPYVPGVSTDWPHGMHVAGIAGARGNNATGVAGVCWNCRLIALRIADWDDVEAAITWVANGGSRRAEVINMSLNANSVTSCDSMPDVRDAIAEATAAGVSVVASAGNRSYTNGARFPANCPNVIGVAASDRNNTIAQYSNRGPFTDVTVPAGAGVNETTTGGMYGMGYLCPSDPNPDDPYSGTNGALSTWMVGNTACYRHLSGTSMAAPHVAGIVGLMRTVNGNLTPAQIESYIIQTANPAILNCPGGGCGAGIVNARGAVDAAELGLNPEIEISTTAVAFGNQQVGTSATLRNVTISNVGAGTLTFTINGNPAGFPVNCNGACSGSLTHNQSRTFTVGFVPTAHGSYSAGINVTSNDISEPNTGITLSGTGIGPIIDVSPTIIAFGNQPVGTTSATQVVTVRNLATATMALNFSVVSNSTDFIINCPGGCSGTLSPGQSRIINVNFRPGLSGTRTGFLTVTHNDLTRGPISVAMSGTGTQPVLTLSPSALDFGVTPVVSPRTLNLVISNTGNAPLTYSLAQSGSPRFFLQCNPCSGTLTPSTSQTIGVMFAPQVIGAHSGTITVTSNDPVRPTVSVPLTGTGTAPMVDVQPPSIDFGSVSVDGSATNRTLTIRNVGNAGLHGSVTLTGSNAADFSLSCQSPCSFLAPGEARVYNVTFDPTAIGARTATINVVTDDPFRPSVSVPLTGLGVAPRMFFTPPSLAFGDQLVGTTSSPRNVTVTNIGNQQLNVIASSPDAAFPLSCGGSCSLVLAPGTSRVLEVRFAPSTPGTRSGLLFLNSNDPTVPTATVALSGTGIAPAVAVSPSSIWFGAALVGTPSTQHVSVRNSGTASLIVSSATVPAGFSVGGTFPATIAPGATLLVPVTCTRAAAGWFSGNLALAHNAGGSSTVDLACSSAAAQLVIDEPADGEFWLTAGASTTVTARNAGPGYLTVADVGFMSSPSWFFATTPAFPVVLAPGETVSWTVTCQPLQRTGSTTEKHYVKHDGLDPGSIAAHCRTAIWEEEIPVDPPGFPPPDPNPVQ